MNKVLRRVGVEIVSVGRHNWQDQEAFIPLEATLKAAAEAGLSVGDYIDTVMSRTPGATQATIDAMARLGVFDSKGGVVIEIGPGSGRYLEKVRAACTPSRYEIYEIAAPWAQYLARTYDVAARPTDGYSLASTPAEVADLVHAHKVFSSIHFMPTCCLWAEMCRVTKPGGHCVFDIMTENCLDSATLAAWAVSGIRAGSYPTAMPRSAATDYFASRGFKLLGSFFAPLSAGKTEVLVFQKERSSDPTAGAQVLE